MEYVKYDNTDITSDIKQPNDNLLINSDFKSGIINQKGQTEYQMNNNISTLTVDGWISIGTFVTLYAEQGYLNIFENRGQIDSYFLQKFNTINGDYTFYINIPYMSGGTLEIYIEGTDGTDKLIISKKGEYIHTFKNILNGVGVALRLLTFNGDISQMKLEKGSYFTGMPIWNKNKEFKKCWNLFRSLKCEFNESIYTGVTDENGILVFPMMITDMNLLNSTHPKKLNILGILIG